MARAKCRPDVGSMCGYGEVVSLIRSRSKKREPGMWRARKEERPVRDWESLGRNHAALRGRMRDWDFDVDVGVDGFVGAGSVGDCV